MKLGLIDDATVPIHHSVDLTLQLFESTNQLLKVIMHLDQVLHLDSFVDHVVISVIFGIERLRAVL